MRIPAAGDYGAWRQHWMCYVPMSLSLLLPLPRLASLLASLFTRCNFSGNCYCYCCLLLLLLLLGLGLRFWVFGFVSRLLAFCLLDASEPRTGDKRGRSLKWERVSGRESRSWERAGVGSWWEALSPTAVCCCSCCRWHLLSKELVSMSPSGVKLLHQPPDI